MGRGADTTGRRLTWAGLWLSVVATWVIQIDFVPGLKLAAKEASRLAGGRPGGRALADLAIDALDPLSIAALAIGGVGLLVAIWMQIRGRHVTGILRESFSEAGRPWALLTLVAAFALRTYLDPGVPQAFDAKQHFAKVVVVTDLLGEGTWPGWTWRWYAGFPLLRFYGPAFYLVAGALGCVLSGPAVGVKATLVILHLASVRAAWTFVALWSGSRRAAAFAALIYLLAFPRYHSLLTLGRLPEAPLFLLFPLLLITVEKMLRAPTARLAAVGGLLLALLVLSHPMLGALGGVFAAAWGIIRYTFLGPDRPPLRELVPAALFAGGLAVALAAFWLVPSVLERPQVLLDRMYTGIATSLLPLSPGDPTRLLGLAVNPLLAPPPGNLSGLGVTVIGFFFVGLFLGVRRDPRRGWPLVAMSGLVLLYLLGPYFQNRAVLYFVLLAAAGAGVGVASLTRPGVLEVVIPALLLLNLLPLSVMAPFRPDLGPIQADVERLAPRLGTGRAVVASQRGTKPVQVSQWAGWGELPLAGLGGPFREGASAVYPWHMTLLDRIAADLRSGAEFPPGTVAACRIFGVRLVTVEDGAELVPSRAGSRDGYDLSNDPPAAEITAFAPAVFAPVLADPPADLLAVPPGKPLLGLPGNNETGAAWRARLSRLVRGMSVSPTAPIAERIFVVDGPAGGNPGLPEGATLKLRDESASHTFVAFSVRAPATGFLQLAFTDYPGVRVFRNDRDVEPLRSVTGHLVIPVDEGWSRVRIVGPVHSPHGWGRWVSLVGLAVLMLALVRRRRLHS